jgi:hypothetical protein
VNHESPIVISPPRSQILKEDRNMGTRRIRYDAWITRAAGVTIALALLGGPVCLQAAQRDKPATNDNAEKGKAPAVTPVKERREPPREIDDPDDPPPDIGPVVPEIRVDRNTLKRDDHRHKSRSLGKVAPEKIESHPQQEIHVLVSETQGKRDRTEKGRER